MKNSAILRPVRELIALSIFATLCSCGSGDFADVDLDSPLDSDKKRELEVIVTENPNKLLPMDFGIASESARESQTFPGSFRIAGDTLEVGRAGSGNLPNISARGGAYLEMPHPDGTPLHIRGGRIRSHDGTVTVSGWPVVVREGKRLVGTTQDTVIKISSNGVQALGPSNVEDLVNAPSFVMDDGASPVPSDGSPFIPLPPDFDLEARPDLPIPPAPTMAAEEPKRRGIIDGVPLNRTPKRGFEGSFDGVDNPKLPGDPRLQTDGADPSAVSTDFGVGNIPPLPTIPGP